MSNDKINYYFYLLAFIDVLGQKEAFADLGNEPLTDDHPKLIEAHKQTAFLLKLCEMLLRIFLMHIQKKESQKQRYRLRKWINSRRC